MPLFVDYTVAIARFSENSARAVETLMADHFGHLNFPEAIPRSMQMVAGQTGQEYNRRKNRQGAYWEDRYHATAVESGTHVMKRLIYIDMNMVRTGVVSHPSGWRWSGYCEIQKQKQRYAIINYRRLSELLGLGSEALLKQAHSEWVEDALKADKYERDCKWSHSVAIGSESYIETIKKNLGVRGIHRETNASDNGFELSEDEFPYNVDFDIESDGLSRDNSYFWNVFH